MTMNNNIQRATIIKIEKVSFSRTGPDQLQVNILKDINLSAESSSITAIVGPSGSGKSSLIRLINRLSDPSSGIIYLNGTDISQIDPLQLRHQIAMVLQKPYMFDGTVLSNLQQPFVFRKSVLPDAYSNEIQSLLELTRLPSTILDREARTLSLGEQQRVNLARALITNPQVLLLDEPTSALDRPTADGLSSTLKEICQLQKLAVILVTHDLRLTERLADYLYYLEGGKIKEHGIPSDLLNNPASPELTRFLTDPDSLENQNNG